MCMKKNKKIKKHMLKTCTCTVVWVASVHLCLKISKALWTCVEKYMLRQFISTMECNQSCKFQPSMNMQNPHLLVLRETYSNFLQSLMKEFSVASSNNLVLPLSQNDCPTPRSLMSQIVCQTNILKLKTLRGVRLSFWYAWSTKPALRSETLTNTYEGT